RAWVIAFLVVTACSTARFSLERAQECDERRDVSAVVLLGERRHFTPDSLADDARDVAIADLHAVQVRSLVAARVESVAVRTAAREQSPAAVDLRGEFHCAERGRRGIPWQLV